MQIPPAVPPDLLTAFSPEPISLDALAAQRAWEVEGVRRGVMRFREAEADKSGAETTGGRALIRRVVPALSQAIALAQAEARERIANPPTRGRPPVWVWYIGLLPADVMAVLVLTAVMAVRPDRREPHNTLPGCPMTILAKEISDAIRLQAEFGGWVEAERQATKDAKAQGGAYFNLYEALRHETKRIDTRAVTTWWRKINRMRSEVWPLADRLILGSFLVHLGCQQSDGRFEIKTIYRGAAAGGSLAVLAATPEARMEYAEAAAKAELGWAWLMPMLVPPSPWERVVRAPKSDGNLLTATLTGE